MGNDTEIGFSCSVLERVLNVLPAINIPPDWGLVRWEVDGLDGTRKFGTICEAGWFGERGPGGFRHEGVGIRGLGMRALEFGT